MSRSRFVAPPVLAVNFERLAKEVRSVARVDADWIDLGIMDRRFVLEIPFGPAVVRAIRKATTKPLNVHLMNVEPDRSMSPSADAGADHLRRGRARLNRPPSPRRQPGARTRQATRRWVDPAPPIAWIEHLLHSVEAGAGAIVAGSAIFGTQDYGEAITNDPRTTSS